MIAIKARPIRDDGDSLLLVVSPDQVEQMRPAWCYHTKIEIGSTEHRILECWIASGLDRDIDADPGSWIVRIAKP